MDEHKLPNFSTKSTLKSNTTQKIHQNNTDRFISPIWSCHSMQVMLWKSFSITLESESESESIRCSVHENTVDLAEVKFNQKCDLF